KEIEAEILTGKIDAYNSFENKDAVRTEKFDGFTKTSDGFTAEIPACSVVKFTIRR
ncbi:MAG: alpha-N-arabinofuranosidase, partial [Clostridia bacterium]|nr:alpha-N-arabinofuranosidase [Clostridia bacterium]